MKTKTYFLFFASTLIALFLWFQFDNKEPEENKNNDWHFKKFSMEIGHEEWAGKLEKGEYTKSGILKIKQNEK